MEAAIALDLAFEPIKKITFEFHDFAAPQTCHVNVVALRAALVVMLFSLEMHEVEFVHQAVALQQVERAVNRDTIDLRIDFLRAAQNPGRIEVLLGRFDHAQDGFALASHAKPT